MRRFPPLGLCLAALFAASIVPGCAEEEGSVTLANPEIITKLIEVPDEVRENARRQPTGSYTFASSAATVLYVNFDGVTIKRSYTSDAATNQSFIGGGTVPAFAGTQAQRDAALAQIIQLYARYNIQIVTTRPAGGDYDMLVIGGTPANLGLNYPTGVLGVAPMDCGNRMPRDIAFVFSGNIPKLGIPSSQLAKVTAESGAHEGAHNYGLPHSGDGCDLMSYDNCWGGSKTFLDKQMQMQSDSYGQCGMTSMNSHQLLLQTLGAANASTPPPQSTAPTPTADTTPPTVVINSPAAAATVEPTVHVDTTITDDTGVVDVIVLIDGKEAGQLTKAPYDFDVKLSNGLHTITVNAFDVAGNGGSASVTVTVADTIPTPPTPSDPSTAPGATPEPTPAPEPTAPTEEAVPGAFGAACDTPTDCDSNLCAQDSDGSRFCTQQCSPGDAASCPSGATCVAANAEISVCSIALLESETPDPSTGDDLAADEELYGGCSVGGSASNSQGLGLALVLALLFLRRRRG